LAKENDDENLFYTPKINFVYEKKGDVFEFELKDSVFSIKWEGTLKEINN
jgi:hypothetical protein